MSEQKIIMALIVKLIVTKNLLAIVFVILMKNILVVVIFGIEWNKL